MYWTYKIDVILINICLVFWDQIFCCRNICIESLMLYTYYEIGKPKDGTYKKPEPMFENNIKFWSIKKKKNKHLNISSYFIIKSY